MDFIIDLLLTSAKNVWATFLHNWPFLVASVGIAVALKLYLNTEKIANLLIRYRKVGVAGATLAAVATPFCSCGTTAVMLGMIAGRIPWAPIIAFMVASPLTSPQELISSAGLFGWPFALAFFISSIILGFLGGFVGDFMEQRGWLENQSRFQESSEKKKPVNESPAPACNFAGAPAIVLVEPVTQTRRYDSEIGSYNVYRSDNQPGEAKIRNSSCCGSPTSLESIPSNMGMQQSSSPATPCGCNSTIPEPISPSQTCSTKQEPEMHRKVSLRMFLSEFLTTGRRLLLMFLGFAFIGYVLNGLIPAAWVSAIFGQGNIYSVPLAATLGLPIYINTETSLPLVRALIEGGMSQGAALAFLIAGAGTSIGAFTGALAIARWRVIAAVVGTLWVGSIALGYLYNLLLLSGLF